MAQFRGWAYADFALVGYDPALHPDAKLHLDLSGIDESKLVLDSTKFTLNEVLESANPSSSRATSMPSVLDAFNQGQKYDNGVANVKKALQDRIAKAGATSPWWKTAAEQLVGSAVGSAAPFIGGLVGFVTSFFGSKSQQATREPLNFEGSLQLQGSISLTRQIVAIDLSLFAGAAAPDSYRPVQRVPWGVFNLTAKPDWNSTWDWQGTSDCWSASDTYSVAPLSYVLNPDAGITIQSIKTAFTHRDREPSPFGTPGVTMKTYGECSEPFYHSWAEGLDPYRIAVEVTLRINQPTRYADRDLALYKVYPVACAACGGQ